MRGDSRSFFRPPSVEKWRNLISGELKSVPPSLELKDGLQRPLLIPSKEQSEIPREGGSSVKQAFFLLLETQFL